MNPVSTVQLGIFRFFFGIILIFQFLNMKNNVVEFFRINKFQLTYDFFHFVKPLPDPYLSILFYALAGFSLLFSLGILYRISVWIITIGFLYVFLLEHVFYNNHYYLMILMLFIMCIGKEPKWGSLTFKPKLGLDFVDYKTPRWNLLLLQYMLFILYFCGGLAKINQEWMFYAQPIMSWLPDMLGENTVANMPVSMQTIIAYFITYTGLFIDLLAGFLLLSKKTFKYIAVVLIAFHTSNLFFFDIGMFPYFGIISIVLFLPTAYLKNWKFIIEEQLENDHLGMLSLTRRKLITSFVVGWMVLHLALPFRGHFIRDWRMWHEIGWKFSWTMKLRTKETSIGIKVKFENDPEDYYIAMTEMLTTKQGRLVAYKPLLLVQFAHKLENYYEEMFPEKGEVKIYAEVSIKLHEHPYQPLVNPKQDLTQIAVKNKIFGFNKMEWVYFYDPYYQPK